jgi:hypothetical protein
VSRPHFEGVLQKFFVALLLPAVFDRRQDVHLTPAQLLRNRAGNMDVQVQCDAHSPHSLGSQSVKQRGSRASHLKVFQLLKLILDLPLDLLLVVVEVRHRRVDLGEPKVRVLAAHLVGRPTVSQVIHDDLGDADAGKPLQPSRLAHWFLDVGIRNCQGHESVPRGYLAKHLVNIPGLPRCSNARERK